GMQPEKGNACLYIVREQQLGLTLLAENLEESSDETIRARLLQPLKALAQEMDLPWYGIVSDAQESIRSGVAKELPGVPHQACQSHCLRKAGEMAFNADRSMKKQLKASFRDRLRRLEKRISRLLETDEYRPVLADYADVMHSTLLEGGVAPFDFGGLRVFNDLAALAGSLARCQKKGAMCFSVA
ncbi:MAG: transposase, partial [Anaerolineales bacterium]